MTLINQHVRPEDLFLFFGEHLILTEKIVRISVKTTQKTVRILMKAFFFEITSQFGKNCCIISVIWSLQNRKSVIFELTPGLRSALGAPAFSHISYGVPQGSILGPLLFLLYINDINNINTYSNDSIKQYADDTCLVINEINLDKLKAKANKLLLSTEQWSSANKLTINFSKCKAMIIAPKLRSPSCTIPILINDIPIPIVDSFRYLGVILDNKLTFSDHISNVAKKVSRSVGIISKLRHYAPTSILLKLYYAILHPHLLYGIIIWGSPYKIILTKTCIPTK